MNLFIDTNVAVDVLTRREPFWEEASRIWDLAEKQHIGGLISAISFTTIFYIVRKLGGKEVGLSAVRKALATFSTVACDERIIQQAIDSGWPDFEDAVQYFSAVRAQADRIVTRDPSHFRDSQVQAITPAEFLSGWDSGEIGRGE